MLKPNTEFFDPLNSSLDLPIEPKNEILTLAILVLKLRQKW